MNQLFSPEDKSISLIHDQLAYLVKVIRPPFSSGQLLTREQLSLLIETAFWASLRSNEGRTTHVCMAVAAPESFHDANKFATPLTYDEPQIVKLAPAVPRSGCLVVCESGKGFSIWGIGRSRPGSWVADAITIEISEPGIVRVDIGPYQPFAVLDGKLNQIVAMSRNSLAHYLQRVLKKSPLSGNEDILEAQAAWRECFALADLARMIVDDSHGGIVLIVSSETSEWTKFLNPFAYRFAVPDTNNT